MASDLKAAITARYREIERLYNAGDYQVMAKECYTEDCKSVFSGHAIQSGHENIVKACETFKQEGVVTISSEVVDFSASPDGELAYCIVNLKSKKADGSEAKSFSNLLIWKKVNGVYLAHVDMSN
ncbi:uncharacterized protein LOC100367130 [Saccoglossus kowalevskii]|uniref:Uncharacterized protein LOC100367130 n=1 Tax=Saccoglossus kowalevskii TaxID=10224 RepID=A0ABM0GU51_SACKO|nr:PREDICTED: uncharacterized protein LOC100367130 [Saccoglossus kowalevskii]